LKQLDSTVQGLTSQQAADRLAQSAANLLKPKRRTDDLALLLATLAVNIMAALLPVPPINHLLGFDPLPVTFLIPIAVIVVMYVIAAETVKAAFYRSRFSEKG
jgi:hypothetical protein